MEPTTTEPDTALIQAAGDLADDLLWPAALATDRAEALDRRHFAAIADLGLFAMGIPRVDGGLGLRPPVIREILRRLGSGCGATAFAFAQHGGVAGALSTTANEPLRNRWLGPIGRDTLGGTAFAHVRRNGPAAVRATALDDGGWRLDGEAPWATSWGLAEVFTVAAVGAAGELVWSLVPGRASGTVIPSAPMSLIAFEATATVRLTFDGHRVEPGDVLSVVDLDRWRQADRWGAVRPNPLCIGIGDRALRLLAGEAPDTAAAMDPWWSEVVERASAVSAAIDAVSSASPATGSAADAAASELIAAGPDAVAAVRSDTVFAVQRLTTALMAAVGGRAADRNHPAQLLARQALFYVVQAQNADGRRATLDALAPSRETQNGDS